MSLYVLFYTLFLTGVSLAAASALLTDIFFFISLRHRRLGKDESKHLHRLSGISSISSLIAIVMLLCLMSIRISEGIIPGESMLITLAILLVITFVCSLLMRNIHLPALKRHQHDYHHLSESFVHHQDSLILASTVSIVSWLFIITIIAADSRGLIGVTNFWMLTISYIVISYVVSKLAVFTKKKIS